MGTHMSIQTYKQLCIYCKGEVKIIPGYDICINCEAEFENLIPPFDYCKVWRGLIIAEYRNFIYFMNRAMDKDWYGRFFPFIYNSPEARKEFERIRYDPDKWNDSFTNKIY